jgi:hypothetical protein
MCKPGYTVFFWGDDCRWWPAEGVDVDDSGALWVLDLAGSPFAVFASGAWSHVECGDRRPRVIGDVTVEQYSEDTCA